MSKQRKYYALNNEDLARALHYVGGFQYLKFDDPIHGKVYSFENSQDLHNAIKELNKVRKMFINK